MLHALPVSADVGTFTLSERTEVRGRDPDQVTNSAAMDLNFAADAHAVLSSPHHIYTLAYTPSLLLLDVNATIAPALLNTLLASGEWRAGHTDIIVSELASYGTKAIASFTGPAPGAPAPTGPPLPVANAQTLPPVQTYLFGSSNTSIASTVTLRPWLLNGTVGYQLSGGADSTAEQTIPFQRGPYAQASADLRAGRHDHLVTLASGLEATFSPPAGDPNPQTPASTTGTGTEVLLLQAQQQWKHALTRTTDTMLAAGLYEARSRNGAFEAYQYTTSVVAEGSVEQRIGRGKTRGSILLDLRLAPVVNQLTGFVDERVQGTLQGSWSRRKVTLRALVTASESIDQSTSTASKIFVGEVDALYAQSTALSLDLGVRGVTQDQNYPATVAGGAITEVPFSQVLVFFGVTVVPVKAHF
jgi:hypothetical protein